MANIAKIQMLLQFKLDNVEKLIPDEASCCLMIKSNGVILNKSDKFHCENASLCVFISPADCRENAICYHVGSANNSLCMRANADDFKVECPCKTHPDEIKIRGKGQVIKTLKCVKECINVNFELLVWENRNGKTGFQMIIDDCENSSFFHDSGFIEAC
jgi:hypothetical protein